VQGGQTYTITAKIRPGATNPSGRTAYIEAFAYNGLGRNFSGGGVSTAVSVTPGAVTTLTFNWTADVGAESVSLWVWYGGAPMAVGETMYVDDVSMKCASTQKVLNSVANVNLAIPTGAVWDVGFGLQSNLPGAFNLGWVTSDRVPHITRLYMDAVPGHTAWSAVTATYTLAALPVDASGVYNVGTVELANYASAAGMDANFHHVMTLNNKTAYFWTNVAGFARESTYDFPLDTGNASNRLSNWHMNNVQAYIFDDFRSLSKGAGYVTKYSSANFWTATNDGYWYCAHAWWNLTSPYHTVIGPKLRVTMTKRARLKLTSSAFPDGDHSAVGYNAANWPNAVRFYVGKNTSTTPPVNTAMYRQVEATETDQTIVIQSIAFSGNTASSEAGTTTFPLSSGGVIKSAALRADGKPRTNLQGDGNNASLDGLIGPGFILEYPGTTDPPGWMIIDGRSLVRATYPDLFNVIGTTFGLGTDTVGGTTFALPNTKDKFVIGASATLAVGATGGQAGMPSHWHNAVTSDGTLDTNTTGSSHSHTLNFEYAATTTTGGTGIRVTDINSQTGGTGTNAVATTTTGGSTHTHSVIGHTASTGSGATADENRPPFVALNRIIKL
jgi:microcystin-dependent protein